MAWHSKSRYAPQRTERHIQCVCNEHVSYSFVNRSVAYHWSSSKVMVSPANIDIIKNKGYLYLHTYSSAKGNLYCGPKF